MHRNLHCFLFSGEAAVRGRVWFSRSVRIIKKQEQHRRRKRGGRRMCRTVETGGGCHCLLPQRCKRLAKLLNALLLFFAKPWIFFANANAFNQSTIFLRWVSLVRSQTRWLRWRAEVQVHSQGGGLQ